VAVKKRAHIGGYVPPSAMLQVKLLLPWEEESLQSQIVFDEGTAQLLFKPRTIAFDIRDKQAQAEERVWRIRQIGNQLASAILNELESAEKKRHG
jgi:hypothetical protein